MLNTDHLIGSKESAQRLGIDRATFNRWVKAGRIVPVFTAPGTRGANLFDPADVDSLVAEERSKKAGAA